MTRAGAAAGANGAKVGFNIKVRNMQSRETTHQGLERVILIYTLLARKLRSISGINRK
jgi:hypothetical protein